MFLKVCGITRAADAHHAVEQGATAVGFVFWPGSPRAVAPAQAAEIVAGLPRGVMTVGVFVNETVERIRVVLAETGIAAAQLHGDEPAAYAAALGGPLLRAVGLDGADAACRDWPSTTTVLLDAVDPDRRGGTGTAIDWARAAEVARRRPIVLAGGLTPENVSEAIATVRPFGVDVSSGVESAPGVKDADKVARFLARARAALRRHTQGEGESGT